jgi:uncharacterized glyoxalase superfamily protein PhnB
MSRVGTYLNFMGNTDEAFSFYRSVFGAKYALVGQDDAVAGNTREDAAVKLAHQVLARVRP